MANSFINEHTVEFVLVPQFENILRKAFGKAIPIFFWSTREGALISQKCLTNTSLRVIALFARRPKVHSPYQSYIQVKFNHYLFTVTEFFKKEHIPVFAGVPLVSSLDDFNLKASCAWFKLGNSTEDEILKISLNGELMDKPHSVFHLKPADIGAVINKECATLNWKKAIEILRYVRGGHLGPGFSFFGGTYQPVYFIIPS